MMGTRSREAAGCVAGRMADRGEPDQTVTTNPAGKNEPFRNHCAP